MRLKFVQATTPTFKQPSHAEKSAGGLVESLSTESQFTWQHFRKWICEISH